MNLSRRRFLHAASAAVATSAMPAILPAGAEETLFSPYNKAAAQHSSAIMVGYAAIAWGGNDTQAMEDISSLGYPGIQIRANAVKEIADPHALKELLDQHHLQLAAFSSGDVLIDPSQEEANQAMHEANAKYVHAAGGTFLQLIGTFSHNT